MIIGIAGVSRSGKTTLADLIQKKLIEKGETAIVLHQDDYVIPENQIPKIRHRIDWECPQSIDFQQFKTEILKAKKHYKHVITEGLLNFWDADINLLFDKKIFVEISKETFLERRNKEKRWGFEPKWFYEHVWESHEKYGKIGLDEATIVLLGEEEFDENLINRAIEIARY
jgi:nicotinamide/nicotinate riboside kinase